MSAPLLVSYARIVTASSSGSPAPFNIDRAAPNASQGMASGQMCHGHCGEAHTGSTFVQWAAGNSKCVDVDGKPLPQDVGKLHLMIVQSQQRHHEQEAALRRQLLAAQQHAADAARTHQRREESLHSQLQAAKHHAAGLATAKQQNEAALLARLQAAEDHATSLAQEKQQLEAGLRSQLRTVEENASSLARAKQDADSKLNKAQKSVQQLLEQQQKSRRQGQAELQEASRRAADAEKYNLQLAAEVADLQQNKLRHEAAMKQLEARLVTSNTREEATAARLQLCQEELRRAQDRLEQLIRSSSSSNIPGDGSGSAGGQAQPVPLSAQATQANAGGSFPMGFGSVEQQQCLDQLGVATQQLAAVLVQEDALQTFPVLDLLKAAREGAANLISSWDRDSCAAALHHQVLNTALGIAQQQVDWYHDTAGAALTKYLACLTSCPEAGRTELHVILQQLQQAKSRTLFLVAQQQAPSHPATREAYQYVERIRQYMLQQLEQQLGLVRQPELVAVAAAMTQVNLLLASLQSSCPGLQLVSRLEEYVVQEGQQACEAPVRQLLGKVEASRPLFLVRPGLVCAAAGGGRQVLVRQQAVALVPDLAWLALQCQQADEQLQAAKLSVIQARRRQCEAAQRKEEADQRLRRCAEQHEGGRQQQPQPQHEREQPGAEEKQASTEMARQRLLAEQSVEDGRRQLGAAARQQQRVKQQDQQAGHKVGKANAMGFQKPVVRNRVLKGRP